MAETVGFFLIEALLAETAIAAGGWVVTTAPATLFGLSAGTVGSAVLIGGALVGGAVAGNLAASPAVFSSGTPADGTQTIKQGYAPRLFGYGRARLAGSYVFYEAEATYSADVLALHYGRVQALRHFYLNDDLAVLNGSGYVTSFYSANASGAGSNRYYNGRAYVQIDSRIGLDTETSYPVVTSLFPDVWTSAHRGDKVASAMLICEQPASTGFFSTFPRGLPRLSVVGDLSLVYDPRTDDPDVPSSWLALRNPVWQIADFLTNADHGLGLDWDTLIEPNIDHWTAQADICDALVTRRWGNAEPRYRSSGYATMETDPADVLRAMLTACDGWLSEKGDGSITIHVGYYVAPSITFTDDHIIGFSISHGVADEELVNELKIHWMNPANDYKMSAGVPWRDETSIAELGYTRSQSPNYEWVQSHSQARRLAKRAMARNQARLRGMLTTTLYGIAALGERWISVQSDFIEGLSDAVVEITRARIDIQSGRVVFEWVIVNTNEIDAWDADEEEGDEPLVFGAITKAHTPTISSTAQVGSTIDITIADPGDNTLIYVVQWSTSATGTTWAQSIISDYTPSGGSIVLGTDAVAAGTWYLRVAAINSENIWSAFATSSQSVS